MPSKWYRNNPEDKIWWFDNSDDIIGKWIFSFDKKQEFYMFRDYPHALSKRQKEIFDRENPYWADFFSDREVPYAGENRNG